MFADYLTSGALAAMYRTFHRTLILWLYPFVALAAIVAVAVAAGLGAAGVASAYWPGHGAVRVLAGLAAFAAVCAGGAWLTRLTFIQHLADLWTFCGEFARAARPEMEQRCDFFADQVLEAVRRDDVDETLLIGHSYGAMMIVEAAARALERDPQAFSEGAPVALLTLGSCLNTSTLHPRAELRRASVRRVAEQTRFLWVDIQGRQDMINYYHDDPGVAAGLADDDERANPVVRRLSLRDMLEARTYARFSMNYFRMHFQTICANDTPHPWDYFLTVAGPDPLADRVSRSYWMKRWDGTDRFVKSGVPVVSAFPDIEKTPSRQ